MQLYQRNIGFKLFSLRTMFLLLLFLSVYLLFTTHADYSILTIIGLLILSAISFTDIKVYDDHFEIRKYYMAGMVCGNGFVQQKSN